MSKLREECIRIAELDACIKIALDIAKANDSDNEPEVAAGALEVAQALRRRMPDVQELEEERAAAIARVAELEEQIKKKVEGES